MPDPVDFLGIVMRASVYSPDTGKTVNFSAVPSGKSDELHMPYLSALSIKEGISGLGEISITLDPPTYEEALDLIDRDYFSIGNTMSVQWGYSSSSTHMAPPVHGMMLKPDINFGSDNWSITIPGTSFGWMTKNKVSGKVWNHALKNAAERATAGLKPRSIKDTIEEILNAYGFKVLWNGKPFDPKNFSESARKVLLDKTRGITQHGIHDWTFVKVLAAQAACRAFMTGGNTWQITDVTRPKEPDLTLVYRGQMELDKNKFPIETFDSETTAIFLPRRGMSARFTHPDSPKSKIHTTFNASEATSVNPATAGKKVVAPPKVGPPGRGINGETMPHDPGLPNKNSASEWQPIASREKLVQEKLQNSFNLTAEQHGVSAKTTGPAVPGILPESYAKVEGVGRYYSVLYRVYEVSVTVGQNFATMELNLKPKGFSAGIASWVSQQANKTQIRNPKPTSGAGRGTKNAKGPTKTVVARK